MEKSVKYILVTIGTIFTISIIGYVTFNSLGYSVADSMHDAEQLAQIFVDEGKSANNCLKIIRFFPNYPPLGVIQSGCIHEYASLTKDPSACELLLPSSYGWSCLGAVEEKLFLGDPCYYSTVRNRVYCNRKYSEGELTIEDPQMNNCSSYERNDLREWCHFERTARIAYAHECDQITHPVVYDNCEYNYAIKMKDIKYCSAIKEPERQNMCKVYLEMVEKYK
ncbi:hypothetical protein KJ652_06565 [Patescibacteria group bacterium]|nr:hypothetical protein [Patescibacteria group bacterium]MBU1124214.1 hypothetical protein [Patescibacteria group bacterium]MBU1911303.1 hypothetical protein [Patescibacteria group bacterium]